MGRNDGGFVLGMQMVDCANALLMLCVCVCIKCGTQCAQHLPQCVQHPVQILKIDPSLRALVVKGAVPGKPGNVLEITPAKHPRGNC